MFVLHDAQNNHTQEVDWVLTVLCLMLILPCYAIIKLSVILILFLQSFPFPCEMHGVVKLYRTGPFIGGHPRFARYWRISINGSHRHDNFLIVLGNAVYPAQNVVHFVRIKCKVTIQTICYHAML